MSSSLLSGCDSPAAAAAVGWTEHRILDGALPMVLTGSHELVSAAAGGRAAAGGGRAPGPLPSQITFAESSERAATEVTESAR